MSNFDDVGHFHAKFGLENVTHDGAHPRVVTDDLMDFRIKFLKEELQEFIDGWEARDHALMADALVDLAYVVFGTAQLLGYPWHDIWDAVQTANMAKVRATSETLGPRQSTWDVVKPPGWAPPPVREILSQYGWGDGSGQRCPTCKRDRAEARVIAMSGTSGDWAETVCPCGYVWPS